MSGFLRYILESCVCLIFFYSAYWLFLKKETYFHLNRVYLVSSLVVSFLIPAINIPSPLLTVRTVAAGVSRVHALAAAPRHFYGADIAALVYFAGVLLFLTRFFLHLAELHRVVRRNGSRRDHGLRVVSVDKEFSPFSFLNVVILNDRNVTADNLQRILAHERVHIRQRHSLDILLMELVIAIQWFNPFVWPYKKSLQETHEYLADEGVIAQGFSVTMYRLLVFEQHVGARLFELANNFKQSQIKRRLTMMSKIKSGNAARLKLLLALPLTAFLVLAFADPRPTSRASGPTGFTRQEKADSGQAVQANKEKATQAQADLKTLKDKELKLRQKLESAPTAEAKQEVKKELEAVLQKEHAIQEFLTGKDASVEPDRSRLEADFEMLQEKEAEIRRELEKTDDPAKQADLKAALAKVQVKQAKVKAMLAGGDDPGKPALEKLKQEYTLLEQKKQEVRAALEKTDDPQKKAELEDTLKKIEQKQEMIKTKAGAVKVKVEAEKTPQEEKKR
jgi:hypothetical protein